MEEEEKKKRGREKRTGKKKERKGRSRPDDRPNNERVTEWPELHEKKKINNEKENSNNPKTKKKSLSPKRKSNGEPSKGPFFRGGFEAILDRLLLFCITDSQTRKYPRKDAILGHYYRSSTAMTTEWCSVPHEMLCKLAVDNGSC